MTWDLIETKWAEMARRMRGDWKPLLEPANGSPADQGTSDPPAPIRLMQGVDTAAGTDTVTPASP